MSIFKCVMWVYIIFSKKANIYYIGETTDLKKRLLLHREKSEKNFTKISDDWEYVLTFECGSKEIAKKLERFVKKQKSKVFNLKIIEKRNTNI